jgi:hypothetical protein
MNAARVAAEMNAARIAAGMNTARIATGMNAARVAAEMNAARIAAEMNAAPHCRRDVGQSGDERSSHCRRDACNLVRMTRQALTLHMIFSNFSPDCLGLEHVMRLGHLD